jgi:hypothetical protein
VAPELRRFAAKKLQAVEKDREKPVFLIRAISKKHGFSQAESEALAPPVMF